MTSTLIAFNATTTLIFSNFSFDIRLLTVLVLILVVLSLVDFIRRFVQFGKRSRYE